MKELQAFVESPRFRELETIPISLNRVQSYLHNPHALPNDVVLYMGFLNEKLAAFRTLFADVVCQASQNIRFGWCSGTWVHPDYRRKGFSVQLLREAYSDWDRKLMLTNYAPDAEKLCIKTGWFKPVHTFEGARAYLFPKLQKLNTVSQNNLFKKVFYSILDFDIELFSTFMLLFFREPKPGKIRFEVSEEPDSTCYHFLEKKHPNHLFHRYEKELNWVFSFPWISCSKNELSEKYPFSWFSPDFQYQTVKFFAGDKLEGFCIFSVRKKHLKTLYFAGADSLFPELAGFLKSYSKKHKIEVLTVYKKELAAQFFHRKFPFLRVKKYGQKIYSTFELPESGKLAFQDGDGDVIFT
ncbi:MAG TPA: hypothetical protein PK335_00475 [Draconibacterium sp.]|nr:hypothetical protein [Draconibacterium sp.]